jgi:hypothetical protein
MELAYRLGEPARRVLDGLGPQPVREPREHPVPNGRPGVEGHAHQALVGRGEEQRADVRAGHGPLEGLHADHRTAGH